MSDRTSPAAGFPGPTRPALPRLALLAAGLAFLQAAGLPAARPPARVEAADILHVCSRATGEGDGSPGAPFATIQQALDMARAGDTVLVGPGTFSENLVSRVSGREGAPIVIRGTLGPGGERLSRIAPGLTVDPASWTPAPEIGPGVFENRAPGFEPALLTIDGRTVAFVHRNHAERAAEMMSWPDDHRLELRPAGRETPALTIPFWETLGALMTHHPDPESGIFRLRLSGGRNPADHEVRVLPPEAAVTVANHAFIEIRDLEIVGGGAGVVIRGIGAHDNLVDNCSVGNARMRIGISNGASRNTVSNCVLAMNFFGTAPGAHGGGNTEAHGRKQYLYNFFKFVQGVSASDDVSIQFRGSPRDNIVRHNLFDGGLLGISCWAGTTGLRVHHNEIRGMSSVGITTGAGSVDNRFHDNLLSDCNINIRMGSYNLPGAGREDYIYRNFSHNPEGVGNHIYVHNLNTPFPEDTPTPRIFIYHNTFVGGTWGLAAGYFEENPMSGTFVLNNIFSTGRFLGAGRTVVPEAFAAWDHNWGGGRYPAAGREILHPDWFGPNNIIAEGETIWPHGDPPDFRLPDESPARGAGLDLSREFKVMGHSRGPLPGMEKGYFSGPRPDLGALQH